MDVANLLCKNEIILLVKLLIETKMRCAMRFAVDAMHSLVFKADIESNQRINSAFNESAAMTFL